MTSTCGELTARRDGRFLAAAHQMVDQDAEAAAGPRLELADDIGQGVDPVQDLDDDALDAQVIAPDALDQGGVVQALDQNPAGLARSARGRTATATEPEAVRLAAPRAAGLGLTSVHSAPSKRKAAGSMANARRLPNRSSSRTRSLPTSTTAPHQPLAASSTTRPGSAATSRDRRYPRRPPPASTSWS